MNVSHFRPTNKNKTLLLELVKLLHKIEEKTYARPQETLEFRMTKPKQSFIS